LIILGIVCVGVYSIDNSMFDLWMMGFFGVIGYGFRKLGYPLAPCVLAVILGPMVEQTLIQSLVISRGSFNIFLRRPICATLLVFALLTLFAPWIQKVILKKVRRDASAS